MKNFIFEIEKVKSADFSTKKITYIIAHLSVVAENEDEAREIVWNMVDQSCRIKLLH